MSDEDERIQGGNERVISTVLKSLSVLRFGHFILSWYYLFFLLNCINVKFNLTLCDFSYYNIMCGNTRMYWNIHVCLGTFFSANYGLISKRVLLHSCIKRTLLFISSMLAHFLLEVLICHYFYYFTS